MERDEVIVRREAARRLVPLEELQALPRLHRIAHPSRRRPPCDDAHEAPPPPLGSAARDWKAGLHRVPTPGAPTSPAPPRGGGPGPAPVLVTGCRAAVKRPAPIGS